ncbi:hypothetical protein [Glycomyces sp. NPDC048151]|uniref:hypothetical protein n=1 Tax=Glycomyces sp. NPDC048151 TaxID=3364002 RepID=UPI00371F08D8
MPNDTTTAEPPAVQITDEEWARLRDIAFAAARYELSTWPSGLIEADDLAQDLMVDLVRSPASTRGLLDEYTAGGLRTTLRRKAFRLAHAAAESRRRCHGTEVYSTVRVRALLEDGIGIIPGAVEESRDPDGSYTVGFAEAADLTAALDLVADRHREALMAKFGPQLSNTYGKPSSTQVTRAIQALTYLVNNLAEESSRLRGNTTRP